MSLQPQAVYILPEETARVAHAIFPKPNPIRAKPNIRDMGQSNSLRISRAGDSYWCLSAFIYR